LRTLRWREMDSDHRSPARKSRFLLRKANCGTERGQAKKGRFLCSTDGSNPSPSSKESVANLTLEGGRDRGFESRFLQRRVQCEPDFRGRTPSMTVGDFANADPAPAPLYAREVKAGSATDVR
jgi:hypothetical protein